MKLDRYSTGVPKFRVFRLDEGEPSPLGAQVHILRDEEGRTWTEVDPWDCYVLKRRDVIARLMITFASQAASILGDAEYGMHLSRLANEWTLRTAERSDSKMPD